MDSCIYQGKPYCVFSGRESDLGYTGAGSGLEFVRTYYIDCIDADTNDFKNLCFTIHCC